MTRLALAAAAMLLLAGCAHDEARVPNALPRALAAMPDVAFGSAAYRPAELRGKVVLVSFDATWCFPCVADLPVLVKLQNEQGPKGFQVIQLLWDFEGRKVIQPYVETYELPFPVLPATEAMRAGQTVFGTIKEMPSRFVFNRQGELIQAWSGLADPKKVIEAVEREVATSP